MNRQRAVATQSRVPPLSRAVFAFVFSITLGTEGFVAGLETVGLVPVVVERSAETRRAILYRPTAADEALLDDIQCGCFNFFWNEIGSPAGLVKDRRKAHICSVAAVGFQLAALPIGVQRGWISRGDGERRALQILRSLRNSTTNRRFGILLHFVDHRTGNAQQGSPELQTSTVDHALFCSGAMVAASYFKGEVAAIVEALIQETDWQKHVQGDEGYIAFGWRPSDPTKVQGEGQFVPWSWKWASDEERIVYFLAVGTPNEAHRVDPKAYYALERRYVQYKDLPPFVASWNSSLFTYFFSHCWIDFRRLAHEDPRRFGIPLPPVDWFENSRRAAITQRTRCIEASQEFKTLGLNRWGLSPCMAFDKNGSDAYIVPGLRPSIANRDDWCLGSVAPYAAASVISMMPQESLAALHEMRHLGLPKGEHIWEDPRTGGYAFAESFNLDLGKAQWDHVGIDVGPMLIAIENYRSGLIWNLFHQHPVSQRAVRALGLSEDSTAKGFRPIVRP
jgi:hypothetical protein